MENVIEKTVTQNDIVIFIKGEPTDTTCGYSSRAVQILNHYGVDYIYENVLLAEDLRQGVKAYSGVKTLPQIFMHGTYFGGSDDIRALHDSDALAALFQEKNIAVNLDDAQPKLTLTAVSKDDVKSCGKETAPRRLSA